jgi:hypothetical protein
MTPRAVHERMSAARGGWYVAGHPAALLADVPVPSQSAAALVDGGTLLVGKTVHGRMTVAVAT